MHDHGYLDIQNHHHHAQGQCLGQAAAYERGDFLRLNGVGKNSVKLGQHSDPSVTGNHI